MATQVGGNLTSKLARLQLSRFSGLAFLILAGCGHHGKANGPAPVNPEAAVRAFMDAVKANNLIGMRDLWGSERGPAISYMNQQEVDQRLTVIRTFLEHERFEFAQPNAVDPSNPAQRVVQVRLARKGCEPVVPFTTVPWKNGWLVKNIGLSAAGNPARACGPQAPGT